jgi:DNA mismatch repair protein MutL
MSDIIRLLPDSVANQIAAGEVIQRPASAVKELLENAIDAGATQIDLVIKDAGKTLIQVTDNGCGMSVTDARMAFERHATSKISSANDLFSIRTMGFRGEALASIAAIAQVEVRSRLTQEELGTCITIEGSAVKSQEVCQCPEGTTFMVKNLFYNVPARRRFLKSDNVELRHIMEEFQRVALAQPHIAFGMFNDRKPVFQLRPENLKQRIVALHGQSYNNRLLPVEQKMDTFVVSGFVGRPEYAKKIRGEQYFFVNKRFMKHAYLNHAVDSAFEELLPERAFPGYFLFIEIDPNEIDINIHPTKTEIKFQDERLMYSVIRSAVKSALGKFSITPSLEFNQEPSLDLRMPGASTPIRNPQIKFNPDYNPFESQKPETAPREQSNRQNWEKLYSHHKEVLPQQQTQAFASNTTDDEPTGDQTFFQLHRTYILSQVKSGLMVIDQQMAHERILYDRYVELLSRRKALSQQLLFPVTIALPPAEAGLMYEISEELRLLGFDIAPDGRHPFHFVVSGIPAGHPQNNISTLLEGIVENYRTNLLELNLDKHNNLARALAHNVAIKKGRLLQQPEMKALVEELFACKVPDLSIDGEPIIRIIATENLMHHSQSQP